MKKVTISHDIQIQGCPLIKAGTTFKVVRFNSRYVYVDYIGCELRLSLKNDCVPVP